MTRDGEDQVLEALRFDWDEVYEIGAGPDGYYARRRDGTGVTMTDEDPGGLRRQIREDYSARPRQLLPGGPGPGGPDVDYLPVILVPDMPMAQAVKYVLESAGATASVTANRTLIAGDGSEVR